MTRRITSGQSNLTGTRVEEKFIITNKSAAKMTGVIFLLKQLQRQIYIYKTVCVARNVISGTVQLKRDGTR